MRGMARRSTGFVALILLCASPVAAEDSKALQERQYPASLLTVKAALQQLGAYSGGRLPVLEGFVKTERAELDHFERPYYEFKLDLVQVASEQTLVRVRANVSAWYADPQGSHSGYRAFESSGRLESDLLDRLNDFLTKNKSTGPADPESVARQVATVRQQRLDAERRVSELEKQLQGPQRSDPQTKAPEYVCVAKPHVPVFSAPEQKASVLLQAQPEDEFAVIERRGAWLRISLEDGRSGWVSRMQVTSNTPVVGNGSPAPSKAPASAAGFTVVRETSSLFSGDWTRLKGKQALYVWVRPAGSIPNMAAGRKLRFAENIFMERYREASHNSQNSVEGIVVIFLDQRGGVAAAALDDIGHWADGSLTHPVFLKKCSFDPPGAFENAGTTRSATLP
jgi:hypothetical protein